MTEAADQRTALVPQSDEMESDRHTGESRYPESESVRKLDPGLCTPDGRVRRGDGLNRQWFEQVETPRTNGTAERHPVRFAYLEALTRRAATQPESVRALLEAKIQEAIRELAAPSTESRTATSNEDASHPLTDLLAHITQHADEQPEATELRSIARFQDTWARLSTEQQLTQTLAQAPENAGPMNSQHLVLRSLQRMHDIAPDYLQSFMSYIDTLIWLESSTRSSAGERESRERPAKSARVSRQ